MVDIIIIAIVLCLIVGILAYLYRAKKHGETCIGCPYAKQCGGKCAQNHDAHAGKAPREEKN